ncbi:MAG: hypothetical protein ACI4JC_10595 [Faecalibacterium sp.]
MNIEKAFKHAEYVSENGKKTISDVEHSFVLFAKSLCDVLPESREKSLFLTKLQEAKFWAIECIAKNCVRSDGGETDVH